MTPAQCKNFERLLNPRHIAFVGGADAIVAVGEARRRGFTGEYWAVNSKRNDLAGVPCYASIEYLPQAPDAVFMAIPAAAVIPAVEKLSAMGAGGIVCYTAGFKEAGDEGARLEAALKDAVGDIALIGPNCYGVINYIDNSALWPFAHGGGSPGFGAAIITQSGMFSSDISMSQRSLPLTYMISAGNQAILGVEDFIEALCEKPEVRAIGVHIEGLRDVSRFERAALKALAHDTPIVALKSGSSAIGAALTVSHTGSLSGANELYRASFERTGVISVTNPAQFLETLKYLCAVEVPKGTRVAGFTCSGGGATMLADHAETICLTFPAFDDGTTCALRGVLPDIATVSNPLDYTTPIWGQPEFTSPVFARALERADIDVALLVQDYPAPGLDDSKVYYQNDATAFADAAAANGIPAVICATLPENMDLQTREHLIRIGVAPMQGIHEALNAIAAAGRWHQARARILKAQPLPLNPVPISGTCTLVDEAEGKAWLARAGLGIPQGRCSNAQQAPDVAREIGFPVVLKMMGSKLTHKTEAGAVALCLKDPDQVANAVAEMQAKVAAYDADAVTDRFLIEQMADPPLAEFIVGIRRDPQFGFAMTMGSGGILVELVGDAKTILLPTSQNDIHQALIGLKATKLLQGFRGKPVANIEGLSKAIFEFSEYVTKHSDIVCEVEINPLFIYEDRMQAVDVLLHVACPK